MEWLKGRERACMSEDNWKLVEERRNMKVKLKAAKMRKQKFTVARVYNHKRQKFKALLQQAAKHGLKLSSSKTNK